MPPRPSPKWTAAAARAFAWLAFLAVAAPAFSQKKKFEYSFSEPRWVNIGLAEGMPALPVRCVAQDSQGYVWVGTEAGLARFDGHEFRYFSKKRHSPEGISHGQVYCLHIDREGLVWVGTLEGLNCFDPKTERFEQFWPDGADSLDTPKSVFCIHDDGRRLWLGNAFGQAANTITCFDRRTRRFENFELPSSKFEFNRHVYGICADPADTSLLAVSTWYEVWHFDKKRMAFAERPIFSKHPETEGAPGFWKLNGLFFDENGRLFTFGWEYRLTEIDPKTGRGRQLLPPLEGLTSVFSATRKSGHEFWLGTNVGLGLFDTNTGRFELFRHDERRASSILPGMVWGAAVDGRGVVWAATGTGLSRLEPTANAVQHFYSSPPGPVNSEEGEPWDAALLPGGAEILTTAENRRGLVLIDLLKKTATQLHYPVAPRQVRELQEFMQILVDRRGRVWLANFGLFLFDRETLGVRRFTSPAMEAARFDEEYITTFLEDGRGRFVISSRRALFTIDPETGSCERTDRQSPGLDGRAVSFSRASLGPGGDLHIGQLGGLLRLAPGGGRQWFDLPREIAEHSIIEGTSTAEGLDGDLWITMGFQGFCRARIEGDRLRLLQKYDSEQGGHRAGRTWAAFCDRDGTIWVTSSNGLLRVDPATGRARRIDHRYGLELPDCFDRIFEQSADGRLLFTAGLSREGRQQLHWLDPRIFFEKSPPPVVRIERARVFDEPLRTDTALAFRPKISLRHDQNFFSIAFTSIAFFEADSMRFSYKLDGFDESWVDNGTAREAHFTNVPPGSYTLLVKARNADGVWSETPARLEIEVRPAYYQTLWFKTTGLLAAAGLVFFFIKNRERQRLAQFRLRERIASDLHDDLGSTLNAIALQTDVATSGDVEKMRSSLKTIGSEARDITSKVRDLVWTLRPESGRMPEILARMRAFAEPLMESQQIDCEWFITPGFEKTELGIEERRHFFLFFKEAVSNLAKHSGARSARLSFSSFEKKIRLEIGDDGTGFDPEKVRRGSGLNNLENRAASLGGRLSIVSKKGEGARVELVF